MKEVLVFLTVVITFSLVVGILVCARGMKTRNVLYKGGFYFFLLSFVAHVYNLILRSSMGSIIQHIRDKGEGIQNISLWVMNLNIPSSLLTAAALIIFIVYLLKGVIENKGEGKG
ncbi:hypothetical protein KVG29_11365 [Caldicoprobacter algeriensis]|nr:hypothetical protein [Caldicoprobacter algeriensis]